MKLVEISVDSQGAITIETTGFTGNACEKTTAELEKALGVPSSRRKKSEYFAMTSTSTKTYQQT